jgi:neutral amino acid transport system ATP-binding protein
VAGYGEVNILQGVSITVPRGAIVSVIGPNGAGKSTLLKAFYGFLKPRGGTVVYHGADGPREISGLKPHVLTAFGLNYVPQLNNAFPNMTVRENLEIGAFLRRANLQDQLERTFEWFPRLAERRKQRAGTLSGGERQMLALARALMVDPQLLFLDEPSAGLAPRVVDEIFAKIREINDAGVTIVVVEQNARKSLAMSDYGYVLDLGRNRFEGPGPELLENESVVDLYLGGRSRFEAAETVEERNTGIRGIRPETNGIA